MVMDFEWDARKAAQNVAKHGGPFDYAARVFLDPRRLDTEDMRFTYREQRWVTLGKISGRLFAVAYTLRGGVVRLISARKANAREQRRYDETLST
jgi:uncharacterized DUF497 family protein